jgi:predicted transcriptional regulator
MLGLLKLRHTAVGAQALGPLEADVMNALWSFGIEASVNDVIYALDRPLVYTTVMTTLNRLSEKGMLDRRKIGPKFFYWPCFSRREWQRKCAEDLLSICFAGSHAVEVLIACLVDAVGRDDAGVLDELERKIQNRRLVLGLEKTLGSHQNRPPAAILFADGMNGNSNFDLGRNNEG